METSMVFWETAVFSRMSLPTIYKCYETQTRTRRTVTWDLWALFSTLPVPHIHDIKEIDILTVSF